MTKVQVSLHEWENAAPVGDSPLVGRSLSKCGEDRLLAERLTTTGRMEVLELALGLELRAKSYVGRFTLGDVTVTIHPKIPVLPLLNLLRYAYGLRHLELFDPAEYAWSKWSFQDLLIYQLSLEVSELLARGLHRDYLPISCDLASPRGRIDFNRYATVARSTQAVLPCVDHPRSEDTLLNQILMSGLLLASQRASAVDLRAKVKYLSKILASTVSLIRVDRTNLAKAWRAMDRRTIAYKPALTLVQLLFGDQGVVLESNNKTFQLHGFLFDMNRFFQALLSRFLRDHLKEYEVRDELELKEMFAYDPEKNPRRHRAPILRPDFVVMQENRLVAVLDAKYRDLWNLKLPSEMLYQLALYAICQSGSEREAVIIYPTLNQTAREQAVTIRSFESDSAHAQVIMRPLNLLSLELLLRESHNWLVQHRRVLLARELCFGIAANA